jgi:hypothetical protein
MNRVQRLLPLLALLCIAADDEAPALRRVDPDNPGGQRYGDDDGSDGFTGYPVDPGNADDRYYDTASEHRDYSPNWTGAWVGGGVQTGWMRSRAKWLDAPEDALTITPYLQASSINHIADVQLAFTHAFSLGDDDVTLRRDSFTASLHAHPSFLSIIGATRAAYTIADWSVMFGPSVERVGLERADLPTESWWRAGWHVGTTLNTYLDSPNDGASWWIGATYRYNVAGGDRDLEGIGRDPLREHNVQLRLTYRFNGNVGAGMPGPTHP